MYWDEQLSVSLIHEFFGQTKAVLQLRQVYNIISEFVTAYKVILKTYQGTRKDYFMSD